MAYKFFVVMQKRVGETYCDLHKTDEKMYLFEEEAHAALTAMGDIAKHFHVVPIVGMLESEYDEIVEKEKAGK